MSTRREQKSDDMASIENVLHVKRFRSDGSVWYSMSLSPGRVVPLADAIAKAGRAVNGYTLEAVFVHLSEIGDPEWATELEFDSENDEFCVRCQRKAPLVYLARRLQRRLAKPTALRRIVKAIHE